MPRKKNFNPKSIRLEIGGKIKDLIQMRAGPDGMTIYLLKLVRDDALRNGIDPIPYGLTDDRLKPRQKAKVLESKNYGQEEGISSRPV